MSNDLGTFIINYMLKLIAKWEKLSYYIKCHKILKKLGGIGNQFNISRVGLVTLEALDYFEGRDI